jgi:hypothetical protein
MTDTALEQAQDEWVELEAEPIDLDPAKVNRTLKALAYKQRDLNEYDLAADDERRELAARHAAESAELEDRIQRDRAPLVEAVGVLTRKLELVGHARLAADPGARTWTLPAGRIAVGGGGVEKVWQDEAAVIAWAEQHCPDALEEQPKKLNKNKLWEAVKAAAVVEKHGRQAPANDNGSIVVDGKPVPGLVVREKDRTVSPVANLDAATGES